MKKQGGFILLMTTILLWVSAMLMVNVLDSFIIQKKINSIHSLKLKAFYQAEAKMLKIVNSIALGGNDAAATLIKVDHCKNQYFRFNLKESYQEVQAEIHSGYVFFNQSPPQGCPKPTKIYERLWWWN